MDKFGDRIRKLRKARTMSLRGMSSALGNLGIEVSHTAIARWEADESANLPKRETIIALARLFNVRASWLVEFIYDEPQLKHGGRQEQMRDLDLMHDEDFKLVLDLKKHLMGLRSKNKNDGDKEQF